MNRRVLKQLVIACLVSGSVPAGALCLGTMSVTATLLNFGNYDPLNAMPKDATSTVSVTCSLIAGLGVLPSFTISLTTGSGSYATRTMGGGTPKLNYNIYTNFARSTVWGDGTSSTLTQSYAPVVSLGSIPFTAYGRIFAGQDRAPGTYTDTITVNVDF